MRIGELAAQAYSSRSGMTRRIDRLVDEGLVTRANSEFDGRGVVVALTAAGIDRLAEAAPAHLRRVSEIFVERLTDVELATLANALAKVCVDCGFGWSVLMTFATLATPITDEDHTQGLANAPVTLVQYGDYECPYTRLSRHSVHQLQREFSDRLRFVFRHFPLEEIHPHARAAAAAAEAAAHQTDFWTMHEYLFEHQKALEDLDLQAYAAKLGLDPERFEFDRRAPDVEQRIDRDLTSGDRSGVEGTPTFFVNGIRHDGGYDLGSLRSATVVHHERSQET